MELNHFDEKHWRFPREHTGDAPERTPPVTGWGVEIVRVLGIALGLAAVIAIVKAVL